VIEPVAVPYKVPEVGRVTEVDPVVKSERALVGENVTTSPPPKVMALVARVDVSETVNVFEVVPPAIVKPVVAATNVKPLTVEGVMAPRPIVNRGAVVVAVQVAVTPLLAAVVSTEVTVPVAAVVQVGARVVPAEVRTCPAEPFANIAVTPADD